MNEDGSNVDELLRGRDIEGAIGAPDWSPDGAQLIFPVYKSGYFNRIHVIGADGTGLTELRARNGDSHQGFVRWSPGPLPDGTERIAYNDREVLSDGSLSNEYVFLMETDGSSPISTGKGANSLSWSPDATRLAVVRRTNGLRVHRFDVDASGNLFVAASPLYDLGVDVIRVAWSKTRSDVLAVTVEFYNPIRFEFWRIDLRDAVASGYTADGMPLFSLATHTVLASSTVGWDCDWSSDDTTLIFRHGTETKKPFYGCFLLDLVSPDAEPEPFYKTGWYPAWRR
ncbi:MAG: TolB family protein [Planctomycetota bacterium]